MAKPAADPASGQSGPPPLQTEAADKAGPASPPAAPNQTAPPTAAGQSPAPSGEVFAAAGAEKQQPLAPAAPLPSPSLLDEASSSSRKDERDGSTTKPRASRRSRWIRVRPAVLWLISLFRLRRRDHPPGKSSPPPSEAGGAGDAPAEKAAEEKEKAQGSKRHRAEAQAEASTASGAKEKPSPQPETEGGDSGMPSTKPATSDERVLERFRKAGRLVLNALRLSPRSRSGPSEKTQEITTDEAPPPHGKEVAGETKAAPSTPGQEAAPKPKEEEKPQQQQQPQQHPLWIKVEALLEEILEASSARLLAGDFNELDSSKAPAPAPPPRARRCLLTFSVFELDAEVKRQAVTYWWAAAHLDDPDPIGAAAHLDDPDPICAAERVFAWLAKKGYLEAIKNPSIGDGKAHGCRVNPLVHWAARHHARREGAADLDDFGRLSAGQRRSGVLCLTAESREWLRNVPQPREATTPDRDRERSESKARSRCCHKPSRGAPRQSSATATAPTKDEVRNAEEEQPASGSIEETQLKELEDKQVIVNVSAHVYRLPGALLSKHAGKLRALQLGRWWNSDDETYMEVESLRGVGGLKELRYLGLRGLSGADLTELTEEVGALERLAVLDMRGCQKLVRVPKKAVAGLKALTVLDLTECYMLEYIDNGVAALSALQVFKGFVFSVGGGGHRRRPKGAGMVLPLSWRRGRAPCTLQDLKKLTKLRKLSINVTTDAVFEDKEMTELRHFPALVSLTVTWGELPSILLLNTERRDQLEKLFKRWTDLVLPANLEKLDVRCYPVVPEDEHDQPRAPPPPATASQSATGGGGPSATPPGALPWGWLNQTKHHLKKLYVRGGDVKTLDIQDKMDELTTLRLRYLKKFAMPWKDLMTAKLGSLRYVEVVMKDPKVMKIQAAGLGRAAGQDHVDGEEKATAKAADGQPDGDGGEKKVKVMQVEHSRKARLERQKKAREEERKLMVEAKKRMEIPDSALDEDGVWVRDEKEVNELLEQDRKKDIAAPVKEDVDTPAKAPTESDAAGVSESIEKTGESGANGSDDASKAQTPSSSLDDKNNEDVAALGKEDVDAPVKVPTASNIAGGSKPSRKVGENGGHGDASKTQTAPSSSDDSKGKKPTKVPPVEEVMHQDSDYKFKPEVAVDDGGDGDDDDDEDDTSPADAAAGTLASQPSPPELPVPPPPLIDQPPTDAADEEAVPPVPPATSNDPALAATGKAATKPKEPAWEADGGGEEADPLTAAATY